MYTKPSHNANQDKLESFQGLTLNLHCHQDLPYSPAGSRVQYQVHFYGRGEDAVLEYHENGRYLAIVDAYSYKQGLQLIQVAAYNDAMIRYCPYVPAPEIRDPLLLNDAEKRRILHNTYQALIDNAQVEPNRYREGFIPFICPSVKAPQYNLPFESGVFQLESANSRMILTVGENWHNGSPLQIDYTFTIPYHFDSEKRLVLALSSGIVAPEGREQKKHAPEILQTLERVLNTFRIEYRIQ